MGTVREEEHAERELALESIDLSPLLLQAPDGLLQLRHSAVGGLDNGRRLLDEAADGSRGAEPQFQTDPRHRRSRLRPTLSFPHSLPLCRLAANENIVQRKRGGRPFYTAQHRRGEERRGGGRGEWSGSREREGENRPDKDRTRIVAYAFERDLWGRTETDSPSRGAASSRGGPTRRVGFFLILIP